MNEEKNLINRILYLTHDKWNIEVNGREDLKEFMQIMLEVEPRSIILLKEILNFDGLVIHKGVMKFIENADPKLFKRIAEIQTTRIYLRSKENEL